MKISIIIATYNAGKTLRNCLESIIPQLGNDNELIVIDGASKDGTVKILKEYASQLAYWISEPDNGIYDAWNKGILKASGEWIMFIGSDDIVNDNALSEYINYINAFEGIDEVELISSKVEMTDKHGNSLRIKGWQWTWPKFLFEMTIAHPGALHSRKLFTKYGLYDTNYKIAGDYELLLRPKDTLNTRFIDIIAVKMMEGGASDSINAVFEQNKAAIKTGGLNPIVGIINILLIISKFIIKKAMRKLGFNVYLKTV